MKTWTDPVNRFSTRVENYAKYRPGYPAATLDLLQSHCGLTAESQIADVGSGTGLLAELFLRNGNTVFGVEPNAAMRAAGEAILQNYLQFKSINGTAEFTTLPGACVDFVTAGQAFHWFDRNRARTEFSRILKPLGWVVLVWNERRLDSSAFLRAYEKLLLDFGTDYPVVKNENIASEIADFFAPETYQFASFENVQYFDFESLKGRLLSASYTPEPGDPNFEPMIGKLGEIFAANTEGGTVAFEYDTCVFYGHLTPQRPA